MYARHNDFMTDRCTNKQTDIQTDGRMNPGALLHVHKLQWQVQEFANGGAQGAIEKNQIGMEKDLL